MQISQGQRLPLSKILSGQSLTLCITIQAPHVIDFVCFGVDAQGKLSDDRYMVFFQSTLYTLRQHQDGQRRHIQHQPPVAPRIH